MGAADALPSQQGSRGQMVSEHWLQPRTGLRSCQPQLCRGRQAVCSHLHHLRGDRHHSGPTKHRGHKAAELSPGVCSPLRGEIPKGKHKSLVTLAAAWSTRTCFPLLPERSQRSCSKQPGHPMASPTAWKLQRLLLHLNTCRAQPCDSSSILTHVLKTMAWACQQRPYTHRCTSSTAKVGDWAVPCSTLTLAEPSWLQV